MFRKATLVLALMTKGQTDKLLGAVARARRLAALGVTTPATSLEAHLRLLSHHFEIENFFSLTDDELQARPHAIVYHLPAWQSEGAEELERRLLGLAGKVPRVAKLYDPHEPRKVGPAYLRQHHDLVLTYLRQHVDGERMLLSRLCYDNHWTGTAELRHRRPSRFACMMLRNRVDAALNADARAFEAHGTQLEMNYRVRREVADLHEVDVYGQGWDASQPNYRGHATPFDRKYAVTREYKFQVVAENCSVDSYISEKLLDSLLTLTVPIYLGSPDIASEVPAECFIHVPEHGSFSAALRHARGLTSEQYGEMVGSIRRHRLSVFARFSTEQNVSRVVYDWYNRRHDTSLGPTAAQYAQVTDELARLYSLPNRVVRFAERRLGLGREPVDRWLASANELSRAWPSASIRAALPSWALRSWQKRSWQRPARARTQP